MKSIWRLSLLVFICAFNLAYKLRTRHRFPVFCHAHHLLSIHEPKAVKLADVETSFVLHPISLFQWDSCGSWDPRSSPCAVSYHMLHVTPRQIGTERENESQQGSLTIILRPLHEWSDVISLALRDENLPWTSSQLWFLAFNMITSLWKVTDNLNLYLYVAKYACLKIRVKIMSPFFKETKALNRKTPGPFTHCLNSKKAISKKTSGRSWIVEETAQKWR